MKKIKIVNDDRFSEIRGSYIIEVTDEDFVMIYKSKETILEPDYNKLMIDLIAEERYNEEIDYQESLNLHYNMETGFEKY